MKCRFIEIWPDIEGNIKKIRDALFKKLPGDCWRVTVWEAEENGDVIPEGAYYDLCRDVTLKRSLSNAKQERARLKKLGFKVLLSSTDNKSRFRIKRIREELQECPLYTDPVFLRNFGAGFSRPKTNLAVL